MEDKVKGQIMRMNSWQKEVTLLGKKVQIFICQTDCGVQLLIAGGDRSHIGSVSIADEQSNLVSHVFDGHRDNVIGDQWAKVLSQKWKVPVVVSVGIHYDSITPQEIQLVVETMTQHMRLCRIRVFHLVNVELIGLKKFCAAEINKKLSCFGERSITAVAE